MKIHRVLPLQSIFSPWLDYCAGLLTVNHSIISHYKTIFGYVLPVTHRPKRIVVYEVKYVL